MLDQRALAREAHVWCLRPDTVNDGDHSGYETLLTAAERPTLSRFQFAEDQRDRLFTKVLTRSVLSAYTGVAPDAWRFSVDQHGKPRIDAPEAFRHVMFSVSHTKGLVACLVSTTRAVGVDVECLARPIRWLDVGTRFFSTTEISILQRRPEPDQQRRFFELWTLKESYAKARGLGLRIPLDGTSFDIPDNQRVSVSFSESVRDDSSRWSFAVDTIGGSHVIATAIAEPGVRVVWHSVSTPTSCLE